MLLTYDVKADHLVLDKQLMTHPENNNFILYYSLVACNYQGVRPSEIFFPYTL